MYDPDTFDFSVKAPPNTYANAAKVLVENGDADQIVSKEKVEKWKEEMDAANVDWSFHDHAKTPHGFALPPRLGPPGKLHEAADRRSTQNMLSLFRELYPNIKQQAVSPNAAGTTIP